MAQSQRVNKKARSAPYIRLPWERHRVAISFDPQQGRTHQSFKDECDINAIIDLHTRTGMVTHLNPGTPQFADCPESTLFEAAVAQAEIRSAIEEGWNPPDDDLDSLEESPPESVEAPQAASQEASDHEDVDQSD